MKIQILTLAVLFSISLKSFSQTTKSDTIRIHADELNWKPAPAPFPAGAEIVAIEGSAKSPGLFTIRVKFPPNYLLPAHFHPEDERVQRLVQKFNPTKISETLPTSEFTAYSENKGEKLAFCLNKEKEGTQLIDLNTLTFVAIHELAHIMTESEGHKQEIGRAHV